MEQFLTRLRSTFRHVPETGDFFWAEPGRSRDLSKRAGVLSNGYWHLQFQGKRYRAGRVAWLYMTGQWPQYEIDHINQERSDDRWCNLRDVPHVVNQQNRCKLLRSSSTGLIGAKRCRNRFAATLVVDGVTRHLGVFDTAEEASAAYVVAKAVHHEGNTLVPSGPAPKGRAWSIPAGATGVPGVTVSGRGFKARVTSQGKRISLGVFPTAEAAAQALKEFHSSKAFKPAKRKKIDPLDSVH